MHVSVQNLLEKIKKPFQQGLSLKEVTNAVTISLLFTIFPVFGVTTFILAFIAIKFKLNLPIMIVISYLASPLQFMLFLPFIHLGENIMNIKHTLLTVQEIKTAFDISFFDTVKHLFFELICGVSGWLLVVVPLGLVVLLFSKNIKAPEKIN